MKVLFFFVKKNIVTSWHGIWDGQNISLPYFLGLCLYFTHSLAVLTPVKRHFETWAVWVSKGGGGRGGAADVCANGPGAHPCLPKFSRSRPCTRAPTPSPNSSGYGYVLVPSEYCTWSPCQVTKYEHMNVKVLCFSGLLIDQTATAMSRETSHDWHYILFSLSYAFEVLRLWIGREALQNKGETRKSVASYVSMFRIGEIRKWLSIRNLAPSSPIMALGPI